MVVLPFKGELSWRLLHSLIKATLPLTCNQPPLPQIRPRLNVATIVLPALRLTAVAAFLSQLTSVICRLLPPPHAQTLAVVISDWRRLIGSASRSKCRTLQGLIDSNSGTLNHQASIRHGSGCTAGTGNIADQFGAIAIEGQASW